MPSSRGSSRPKDRTRVSCVSCISRRVLYHERLLGCPRKLNAKNKNLKKKKKDQVSHSTPCKAALLLFYKLWRCHSCWLFLLVVLSFRFWVLCLKQGLSRWLSSKDPRLPTRETRVPSLGGEDPLEDGAATHSSVHAWSIPRTGEPGGLHSRGLPRVGHDLETQQQG